MKADMGLYDEVREFVVQHSEPNETRSLFWLSDDNGQSEEDYCRECVDVITLLPGLVMLHLLTLVGAVAVPHEVAHKVREEAQEARDGGWASESDGFRYCGLCGIHLNVILTRYAVAEELAHWQEHPPTSGRDWWEFELLMDAIFGWGHVDVSEHAEWPVVQRIVSKAMGVEVGA